MAYAQRTLLCCAWPSVGPTPNPSAVSSLTSAFFAVTHAHTRTHTQLNATQLDSNTDNAILHARSHNACIKCWDRTNEST